ncbi:multiple organellar RNA editing factor 3, mitochondrial-like [Prosopis cineraria]|uniref:multiple organellar RNA editing factor 3, mitochondrial-like n=1 Tax=Prosopis cineraria TaxID=364024 RepID=UPI0024109B68|nr:multiple organellar RNA editing factor 3, mitochondrial-like [Prosopis cineraria]
MAFSHARRALASSLLRAISSSSSSSSFSTMASSRSRIAFAVLPKQIPLLPRSLKFPIRFQTSVSESEESPADDKSEDSEEPKDSKDSSKKSAPPKDTILLAGCDLKHWLIIMDFPQSPKPSEEEMVNTYVKTLAEVVGSEEEAKKKIYSVATVTYTGFGAEISEELSTKVKGLPGVLWVLPDSYLDIRNKDYGGDLFVDGKVIPRPQFRYKKSENKQPNEVENDRNRGRPRDRSRKEGSVPTLRHGNRDRGRRP